MTGEDAQIPRQEFTAQHELNLFPLDMCEITCPDCERTAYPSDLGEAVDWALGHQCLTPGETPAVSQYPDREPQGL
jgi:hypothetical protein